MKVLVINSGSSSIKYEIFDAEGRVKLASGLIERIGSGEGRLRQRLMRKDESFDERSVTVNVPDHRAGFELMEKVNREAGIIRDGAELLGIGHRVVHGGELFRDPALVDDRLIAAVRELIPLAPLHNPSNLLGIEIMRQRYSSVAQVAVFDTAFHHTLPEQAYLYPIPYSLYRRHRIRRYGFHGTSHRYVAYRYRKLTGRPRDLSRVITLHLGNGCSACAIEEGQSVDTSMGFTPLEGLVMGTRSGDLDPAVLDFIAVKEGLSLRDVETLLNKQSGLLGLSGLTHDMRELLAEEKETGDRRARLAIDVFCYRARKYVGAYFAAMQGADAILFTGGIGENSPEVRARIVGGLDRLGVDLDPELNERMVGGAEGRITRPGAPLEVWVIPTNEELLIARDTARLVLGIENPY